jgi:hypothetical protein
MDDLQKKFLARKAEKMNDEWQKTGKFIEYLDRFNLLNKKIFAEISKIPKSLKYILVGLIVANIGIWLRYFWDFTKFLP